VIQTRLSPEYLKQEAKYKIRTTAKEKVEDMKYTARSWRYSLTDTIRENPLPTALIGIGLGWLLMESATRSDEEYYPDEDYYYYPEYSDEKARRQMYEGEPYVERDEDRVREQTRYAKEKAKGTAEQVKDKAGDVVEGVKEKASEMTHRSRERAEHLTGRARERAAETRHRTARKTRYQTRRAKRGVQNMFEENPLAMGAVAVAAGTIVGLMAPSTRKEDEWMGDTRDRLVDRAKATAQETAEQVRDVALEAQHSAKETAKEEARRKDLPTAT
jgi:ElaB/YqjD/DUF883 family membrane-anchored ribosome-binding protein